MRISYINILLTISLLLYSGCSADDPEPVQEQVATTFTIMSRATQDEGAGANDAELINTWWMAFVDNNGIVRLILDRPENRTEAVEREEFRFNLGAGLYTVYAFANIDRSTLGTNIAEGLAMPDLSATVWNKEIGSTGARIPMTGKRTVNIAEGKDNSFEIEVVRLWAKLCFQFTTNTAETVTVSKISMTSALTPAVNLLPDYNSLGSAPVLPDGTVCSLLERTTNLLITNGNGASETFYLFESTAKDHPTGRYPVSFELKYGDGALRTVSALAYNLAYINRNDFITIPVLITDWLVDVNVLFYPPIGGYPTVVTESKDNEFYAKFGSAGKFVIRPTVTSADGSIVANSDLDIALTTEDSNGILSQAPAYDNNTSEIIGEIATGKTGTATVTLEINIKTNKAVQQTITRKFYIIRQDL